MGPYSGRTRVGPGEQRPGRGCADLGAAELGGLGEGRASTDFAVEDGGAELGGLGARHGGARRPKNGTIPPFSPTIFSRYIINKSRVILKWISKLYQLQNTFPHSFIITVAPIHIRRR
jgi:hypothetical protein